MMSSDTPESSMGLIDTLVSSPVSNGTVYRNLILILNAVGEN